MTWFRHAWHAVGLLGALALVGAVLFLASAASDRIRRAETPIAGQVVVAKQAPVVSVEELIQKYGLKGPVVQAPKPGTQKRTAHPSLSKAQGSREKTGSPGASPGQSSPPDQARADDPNPPQDDPDTTETFPEQEIGRYPYGATALPTLMHGGADDGALHLLVVGKPRPWFQLGGLRRAGVAWDPIAHTGGLFYEHDLASFRLGSRGLVLGIRPFAAFDYQALPGARTINYGLPITVAVEFQ